MEETEVVVSEVDSARYLGVSTSTLRRRRAAHVGPDYVQIGKLIRYRKQALESFLEKHSARPRKGSDERCPGTGFINAARFTTSNTAGYKIALETLKKRGKL